MTLEQVLKQLQQYDTNTTDKVIIDLQKQANHLNNTNTTLKKKNLKNIYTSTNDFIKINKSNISSQVKQLSQLSENIKTTSKENIQLLEFEKKCDSFANSKEIIDLIHEINQLTSIKNDLNTFLTSQYNSTNHKPTYLETTINHLKKSI